LGRQQEMVFRTVEKPF